MGIYIFDFLAVGTQARAFALTMAEIVCADTNDGETWHEAEPRAYGGMKEPARAGILFFVCSFLLLVQKKEPKKSTPRKPTEIFSLRTNQRCISEKITVRTFRGQPTHRVMIWQRAKEKLLLLLEKNQFVRTQTEPECKPLLLFLN